MEGLTSLHGGFDLPTWGNGICGGRRWNAAPTGGPLDDAIQLDLSDTMPVIVTDENVTKLRVDNVMDLAEERPMNLIHGQHVFRVAGFNMVLTDVGAVVFLENALGTRFQVIIDEIVSKQLFKAHTAELLPPGDYKLVVMSRAGDAGGPLQTSFRKVKYLRVVDPTPTEPTFTKVTEQGHEDDAEWVNKVGRDGRVSIVGTNLTAELVAKFTADGNEETFNVAEVTDTLIKGQIAGGLEYPCDLTFSLEKPDGDVVGATSVDVVDE